MGPLQHAELMSNSAGMLVRALIWQCYGVRQWQEYAHAALIKMRAPGINRHGTGGRLGEFISYTCPFGLFRSHCWGIFDVLVSQEHYGLFLAPISEIMRAARSC